MSIARGSHESNPIIIIINGPVTFVAAYIASECHSYGNQVLKLKRKFYNEKKEIKHLTCILHSCTDIYKQTITQHHSSLWDFSISNTLSVQIDCEPISECISGNVYLNWVFTIWKWIRCNEIRGREDMSGKFITNMQFSKTL